MTGNYLIIYISNTVEGKEKLQSLLDKGWHVHLSLPLVIADDVVRLSMVFFSRTPLKEWELSIYHVNKKEE